MISAQIDELRQLADLYEALQKPAHVLILREAADTIWQLRDDLQRANDAVQEAEHDESMAWDRVRKAETENDKLREYGKLMHGHIKECCDACGERDTCDVDALTRSLGIEAD